MEDVVHDGFVLVLALAWPLVAAAAAGAAGAAVVARWTGVQDPALGVVARMIAVAVAIGVLAAGMAASLRSFADEAWTRLPALGRKE